MSNKVVLIARDDYELSLERTPIGWDLYWVDGDDVAHAMSDLTAQNLMAITSKIDSEIARGTPGLVRAKRGETGVARSEDSPEAPIHETMINLLQMAADALGDDDGEKVVDIMLDDPLEIQAAMLLELRGKGTLLRADVSEVNVVESEDGRKTTERVGPVDLETIWRISRAQVSE